MTLLPSRPRKKIENTRTYTPFFQVFVKGRRDDFMAHPEEALHWGSEVFPSEKDFQMMAKSYLRSGFFYKIDELIWR